MLNLHFINNTQMTERNSENKNTPRQGKAKRCQFTLSPEDVVLIDELRIRYQKILVPGTDEYVEVAKSEIVRAGLRALGEMSDKKLRRAVQEIEKLQEGRPKK